MKLSLLRHAARKANHWPLAAIYLVLLTVGLGWIGVWVLHDSGRIGGAWLDTWAPHGASVALGLFIATVVVGGLLRRQERTELQPLRETALFRLRLILASFLRNIAVQYAFLAPDGSQLPERRSELISSWLELLRANQQAWLPQWFRELDRFSLALETLRDRYERELDPRTVSLIDAFLHHWREDEGLRLRSTFELAKSIAPVFGVADPNGKPMTRQQIMYVEAVISHAVTICDRYEEISEKPLELDTHAREQFRLAQVARRAAVHPADSTHAQDPPNGS